MDTDMLISKKREIARELIHLDQETVSAGLRGSN